MSSSKPKRPIISVYDYPEHLNPFNDTTNTTNPQPQMHQESKSSSKESKHKFWTFGRSRKKRSNSFSLKSTWNGLFGKRKESPESTAKKSTITTISTTYKREPHNTVVDKPTIPPRLSKDQQEFDEALGTLTRRRKYTFDNTRYSSNLTVNGDPAKLHDGNPQDTTTSIMNVDLTPKPPIRRFGQVSPRPTDKIPPLDFDSPKEPKQNGDISLRDKSESEGTPVPPIRRFGNRSSQRSNGTVSNLEEDSANQTGDTSLRDENENVPEDYVFKRFSQDAVRRSNLSINSCISVTSTTSAYGRKKRRAPQPPQRREQLETSPESENGQSIIEEINKMESTSETNKVEATEETSKTEIQITDTINIVTVTENIDEMTKKSCEKELNEKSSRNKEEQIESDPKSIEGTSTSDDVAKNETCKISKDCMPETKKCENSSELGSLSHNPDESAEKSERKEQAEEESKDKQSSIAADSVERDSVNVEYERTSQEKLEIIKDIDQDDSDEVCLRKKSSLSRSDSFSVKEEIEKIERQIKALESRQEQENADNTYNGEPVTSARLSIQANRRHFFENMVDGPSGPIKLEFKKLPCEQKDIHVVRLTDPPQPTATPRDPVKVIELHISEPIRRKPELLDEVNPIPKPRRHSALGLRNHTETKLSKNETPSPDDKRGQSF